MEKIVCRSVAPVPKYAVSACITVIHETGVAPAASILVSSTTTRMQSNVSNMNVSNMNAPHRPVGISPHDIRYIIVLLIFTVYSSIIE